MPEVTAQADSGHDEREVRGALEHMAASEAFRGSPQLVAFLRYVVEQRLRGAQDRIKGYTIAVEALGRPDDFDPQADPIVRVEATRLRRALNRYYDNSGKDDPIVIELPLGSYVPVFRRNDPAPAPEPEAAAAEMPAEPPVAAVRRGWQRWMAPAALVVLAGAVVAGIVPLVGRDETPATAAVQPKLSLRGLADQARAPVSFPIVFIGAFDAGSDDGMRAHAETLRSKLRDALARFDDINVMSGAAPNDERTRQTAADPSTANYYALTARMTAEPGGANLSILLTDVADDRVVFTRVFHFARGKDEASVREIAVMLAQPYGIIHSRERVELVSSPLNDARYPCLLDYYDYWRTNDSAQHARVRDCLEQATAADPSFSAGYAALAEILLHEHRRSLNQRPGDPPALDRAIAAARRAVELKPGSALAHQALMDVFFVRGEYGPALEAGARAVVLNPYNPNVLGCYGARLLSLGEVEKGARYVREAAQAGAVRPAWLEFFLFVAAYLQDNPRAAADHASQIVSVQFPPGLLARALVAMQAGRHTLAREHLGELGEMSPPWRTDVRGEIRKMFPSQAVADRLIRDLSSLSAELRQ